MFWLALAVLSLAAATASTATTITVQSTDDGAANAANCPGTGCRLRDALAAAVAGDTINFSVTGAITLTSGQLVAGNSVTISGPGANLLTVRRDPAAATNFRIFQVGNATVTISGLTISGGRSVAGAFPDGFGGGIHVFSGNLTINRCTISGNFASNVGGAIYMSNSPTLTINNSTISGNTAPGSGGAPGAGGAVVVTGVATVNNSTISDNSTDMLTNGAVSIGVGATFSLNNSTVAHNPAGGILNGDAVGPNSTFPGGGTLNLNNSIAANNSSYDISGPVASGDFNLVRNTASALPGSQNITGVDPMLGALAFNGGPTRTHALLGGSPAIDKGKDFNRTGRDQRDSTRPVDDPAIANAAGGDGSDIGAVEFTAALEQTCGVVNGSFESNTFGGWTIFLRGGSSSSGNWFVYTGTTAPLTGAALGASIAAPPDGTYAAVADMVSPGTHILYQDVAVPSNGTSSLSFYVYYKNQQSSAFFTPPTLDPNAGPNQQYRVDLITTTAPVDSVAGTDVLANLFITNPGDPAVLPPTLKTYDVTAFAGQMVRLRFAEADNSGVLNASVDAVCLRHLAITASGVVRTAGTAAVRSAVAQVENDAGATGSLTVTVNNSASATVNGVTVSNLAVDAAGVVTADVVAACGASNASFTLKVTDTAGLSNSTTLSVTVNPNPAPVLTYSSSQAVNYAGSRTITPATGPTDNGSVATIAVQSIGTYTGAISVDNTGVVSVSNATPPGNHTILIRATDNCGATTDASFTLAVARATPAISTQASPAITIPGNISDTATLATGFNPTGTITFTLYGPNDASCGGPVVFTSTKTVSGNGSYPSDAFTLVLPGMYRWIASYSGDALNSPASGSCNDPNESVEVSPLPTPTPTPSPTPTPTPSPSPAQPLNLSTRLRVETGDKAMIGGFIITGNVSKPVVLRGMGPSLTAGGMPPTGLLQDPVLELHAPDGSVMTRNDNWKDSPQRAQIEGTTFQPGDDRESVIVATLPPAAYTAVLTGSAHTTGVGLIEIYDKDASVNSALANISTRGFVQTGNDVLIGGFMLGRDPSPTRIVIRGIGPSLAQFGLAEVLADPVLELHDENGSIMLSNDNWMDDPVSAAKLIANGLAPQNAQESGIVASLPPGQFTVTLSGKNGGTGIGLLEIYNLK